MNHEDIEDWLFDWLPIVGMVALVIGLLAFVFVVSVIVYAVSAGVFR